MLSLPTIVRAAQDCHLYVSPAGNDANSGSQAAPLASLQGAKTKVRTMMPTLQSDISVCFADGLYPMNGQVINFDENDGHATHTVSYEALEGAQPVFSNGVKLGPWTHLGGGLYSASAQGQNFRTLSINGRAAPRARSVDDPGILPVISASDQLTYGQFVVAEPTTAWRVGLSAAELQQTELVLRRTWNQSRLLIDAIEPTSDPGKVAVKLTSAASWMDWCLGNKGGFDASCGVYGNGQPEGRNTEPVPIAYGLAYYFEGNKNLIDVPGEWALDTSTDRVYVMAPEGATSAEEVDALEIFAPRGTAATLPSQAWDRPLSGEETFIVIRPTANASGAPNGWVKNLTFKGLAFAHSNALLYDDAYVSWGWVRRWVNWATPISNAPNMEVSCQAGVVELAYAENIRFEQTRFTALGGSGIRVMPVGKAIEVSGSLFDHIGAVGVCFEAANGGIVRDSIFRNVGFQVGAGAIRTFGSSGVEIEGNDMTQTASGALRIVNLGALPAAKIKGNRISAAVNQASDMGAIYLQFSGRSGLGLQAEILNNNVIGTVNTSTLWSQESGETQPMPIYVDFDSYGAWIQQNAVFWSDRYIYLQHAAEVTVVDNHVGHGACQLLGTDPACTTGPNSVIMNNNGSVYVDIAGLGASAATRAYWADYHANSTADGGSSLRAIVSSTSGLSLRVAGGVGHGGGVANHTPVVQGYPLGLPWMDFVFKPDATEAGAYQIIAPNSQRCLDLAGPYESAPVVLIDCNHSVSQRWFYWTAPEGTYVGNRAGNKCLTILGASLAPGAPAVAEGCVAGKPGQLFDLSNQRPLILGR